MRAGTAVLRCHRRTLPSEAIASTSVNVLVVRAFVELLEGRPASALAISRHPEMLDDSKLIIAARAYHALGQPKASRRALETLIERFADSDAYQVVEAYAWRGKRDKAVEWLERAYRQRDVVWTRFADPDPRVRNLCAPNSYLLTNPWLPAPAVER